MHDLEDPPLSARFKQKTKQNETTNQNTSQSKEIINSIFGKTY